MISSLSVTDHTKFQLKQGSIISIHQPPRLSVAAQPRGDGVWFIRGPFSLKSHWLWLSETFRGL